MSAVRNSSNESYKSKFKTAEELTKHLELQANLINGFWENVPNSQQQSPFNSQKKTPQEQLALYDSYLADLTRHYTIASPQKTLPEEHISDGLRHAIQWLNKFYIPKHHQVLQFIQQTDAECLQQSPQQYETWIHAAAQTVKNTLSYLSTIRNDMELNNLYATYFTAERYKVFQQLNYDYEKQIESWLSQCRCDNRCALQELRLHWLVNSYIPGHTSLLQCARMPDTFRSSQEREQWMQEVVPMIRKALDDFLGMTKHWKLDDAYRELELEGFCALIAMFNEYINLFINMLQHDEAKKFNIEQLVQNLLKDNYMELFTSFLKRLQPENDWKKEQKHDWAHKVVPKADKALESLNYLSGLWATHDFFEKFNNASIFDRAFSTFGAYIVLPLEVHPKFIQPNWIGFN